MKGKNIWKTILGLLLCAILITLYTFDFLCFVFGTKYLSGFLPLQGKRETVDVEYFHGLYRLTKYLSWGDCVFYKSYTGQNIILKTESENGLLEDPVIEDFGYFRNNVLFHIDFVGIEGMTEFELYKKLGMPSGPMMGGPYAVEYKLYDGSVYFVYIGAEGVHKVTLHHPLFGKVNISHFQIFLCIGYTIVVIIAVMITFRVLKKRRIISKKKSTEPPAPTE